MSTTLSPRTAQLIERLFSPQDVTETSHWLEDECGNNLSICDTLDEAGMERIRFAVLKLSKRNVHKLLQAIE